MMLEANDLSPMTAELSIALYGKSAWQRRHKRGKLYEKRFLLNAAKYIPAYQNIPKDKIDLSAFPITDKKVILSQHRLFISNRYNDDELYWATTNGTSGVPLKIPFDHASKYAMLHRSFRLCIDYIPGQQSSFSSFSLSILNLDQNPIVRPVRTISPAFHNSFIDRWPISRSPDSDVEIIRALKHKHIPVVVARPKALIAFKNLCQGELHSSGEIGIGSIIAGGDNLTTQDREDLESYFKKPVHNMYGSKEGGVIGIECGLNQGMHIFEEKTHVEVLTESGHLSDVGHGEIVVTNFDNWAMGFIRYRSGDFGIVEYCECPCGYRGKTINQFSGRAGCYFRVRGEKFDPLALNPCFLNRQIYDFQIRQVKGEGLRVKWASTHVELETSTIISGHIRNEVIALTGIADVTVDYSAKSSTDTKYSPVHIPEGFYSDI